MIRTSCAFAAAGLLCACSTTVPGWKGSAAVPFGQAEADCTASVSTIADPAKRDQAFAGCMAEKGWTRT